MFTLPTDFTTGIGTNATGTISALSPVVQLILGVLLGAVVISIIISTLTHHK